MKLKEDNITDIHSYKHNEIIHRVWRNTKIVEINEDLLVTAHKKTRVYEQTGRSWYTREPALCFFYGQSWFNVIVMFKKSGIYYYCNISSPYLYDGEAIKYIDYDLDVKVFPNGSYIVLDKNEYKYHSKLMNYSDEIKRIIKFELDKLIKMIEKKEPPFSLDYVNNYYEKVFGKKGIDNE